MHPSFWTHPACQIQNIVWYPSHKIVSFPVNKNRKWSLNRSISAPTQPNNYIEALPATYYIHILHFLLFTKPLVATIFYVNCKLYFSRDTNISFIDWTGSKKIQNFPKAMEYVNLYFQFSLVIYTVVSIFCPAHNPKPIYKELSSSRRFHCIVNDPTKAWSCSRRMFHWEYLSKPPWPAAIASLNKIWLPVYSRGKALREHQNVTRHTIADDCGHDRFLLSMALFFQAIFYDSENHKMVFSTVLIQIYFVRYENRIQTF